jgi:hypothetical protein
MTVSDKFAVNRHQYQKPRQGARAVSNNELTNKSVSRPRKGKCQTTPRGGRTVPPWTQGHGSVLMFHCAFVPVSIAYLFRDRDCRLTLLTKACQKRQNFRRTGLYIDATPLSRLTFLTPACQICQTVERGQRGFHKPYDTKTASRLRPAVVPSARRINSFKGFLVKWLLGGVGSHQVPSPGNRDARSPAAGVIRPDYPHGTSPKLAISTGRTA